MFDHKYNDSKMQSQYTVQSNSDLVANSTPIVLLLSRLNSFLVKRERRLLFPTPESPINTTGNNRLHYYENLSQRIVREQVRKTMSQLVN